MAERALEPSNSAKIAFAAFDAHWSEERKASNEFRPTKCEKKVRIKFHGKKEKQTIKHSHFSPQKLLSCQAQIRTLDRAI